eukprot:338793-Pelagomonas_calceolata.AAC.1
MHTPKGGREGPRCGTEPVFWGGRRRAHEGRGLVGAFHGIPGSACACMHGVWHTPLGVLHAHRASQAHAHPAHPLPHTRTLRLPRFGACGRPGRAASPAAWPGARTQGL